MFLEIPEVKLLGRWRARRASSTPAFALFPAQVSVLKCLAALGSSSMVSFDGPVGRNRAREGTCTNGAFTRHYWRCGSAKLALRSRHRAVHAQIPLHPARILDLPASAYQDACMKISSPFPSTLTAVSGKFISSTVSWPARCMWIHVPSYPCIQSMHGFRGVAASAACAARFMELREGDFQALTSPRGHRLPVGLYKFVGDPEFEMPQSARPLERH